MSWDSQSGSTPSVGKIEKETLESLVASFDPLLQRMGKLSDTLGMIGEHIEGSSPKVVPDHPKSAPTNSIVDGIRRRQKEMTDLVARCENLAERISASLG